MKWRTKYTHEITAATAEVEAAEERLAEVQRRWPTVQEIATALTERRLENGFGEQLEVAWTPRRRTHA